MKKLLAVLLLCSLTFASASAQKKKRPINDVDKDGNEIVLKTAAKLNAAVVVGVINPAIEFRVHKYLSVQLEAMGVFAPKGFLWTGAPLTLATTWAEVRYYPRVALKGFFVGPNIGWGVFRLSKGVYPMFPDAYKEEYQVGSNLMAGLTIGYQFTFCKHWGIEISWGGGYQLTDYEGHRRSDGSMYIGLNESAEWLPAYKAAINIVYKW